MKAYLSSHDQKFWTEFLTMYRNSPCLWNIGKYGKDVKNAAIQRLVEKYKKICPQANEMIVKKKIHSFRCAFLREHNKVISMKVLGKEYNPSLWYYELLLFLTTRGPNVESENSSDDETETPPSLKIKLQKKVLYNSSYFDIAGMKYAKDLASLDHKQRILVEKAVQDTIFNAKLGKLTDTSSFQVNKLPAFDFIIENI